MINFKKIVLSIICTFNIICNKGRRRAKLNDLFSVLKNNSVESSEFFLCKKSKIAYLVNSKVACSSIKVSLAQADGLNINFANYNEVHTHPDMLGKVLYNSDVLSYNYFIFTYVRNPYSRLLSAWINKFNSIEVNDDNFEFKNYLGGFLKRTDSFLVFLLKISIIPDDLSDRHFVSQSYWLFKKNSIDINYIGRLESIDITFLDLIRKFDLAPLQKFNVSSGYKLDDHYDFITYLLVNFRYKSDFDLFGYKPVLKWGFADAPKN